MRIFGVRGVALGDEETVTADEALAGEVDAAGRIGE